MLRGLLPSGHESLCRPPHVLDINVSPELSRPDTESGGTFLHPRLQARRVHTANRNQFDVLGQDRAPSTHRLFTDLIRGKNLECSGTCLDGGESLGHRGHAGTRIQPESHGLLDDPRIGVRGNHQLGAGLVDGAYRWGGEHRTRAHADMVGESPAKKTDRLQRVRGVERDLERLETGLAQNFPHLDCVLRCEPSQDGDEAAGITVLIQQGYSLGVGVVYKSPRSARYASARGVTWGSATVTAMSSRFRACVYREHRELSPSRSTWCTPRGNQCSTIWFTSLPMTRPET